MVAAKVTLAVGTSPSTPGAGKARLYGKTDKKPYWMDDSGTETPIALGGVVGPANTVYLSVGGVDGSAARGDASKPFGSLKAALAACVDGDCLRIGPGTFTIASAPDEPVWPAGLNHLSIIGSGNTFASGGTKIINSANDGSHIFAPVNTAKALTISDLYAQVTLGTGRPLYCDGTGGAGDFLGGNLDGGLILRDCTFLGAGTNMTLKYVGLCYMYNMFLDPGGSTNTEITSSNVLGAYNSVFGQITYERDGADVNKPVAFLDALQLFQCFVNNKITVTKQPKLIMYDTYVNNYLMGTGLTAIAGFAPSIETYGGKISNIDFSGARAYPDTTESSKRFRLHGTIIDQGLQITVAGAATNRLGGTVDNCDFRGLGNGALIVGAGVDMDCGGSALKADCSQILTQGTGTILVDRCARTFTTDGTSTDTVSIDQSSVLTFTRAPDYCFVTPKGTAAGIVAASPLSATQVTITYSINAAQDCQLLSLWK